MPVAASETASFEALCAVLVVPATPSPVRKLPDSFGSLTLTRAEW